MRLFFQYMKPYRKSISIVVLLKLLATMTELLLPYILEHIIDVTVPTGVLHEIFLWGFLMIATAFVTRALNIAGNKRAGCKALWRYCGKRISAGTSSAGSGWR